uniref:Secreted protein n=1 Tax=Oncorhynchus tshawytscha TaxID=74940 RepID=A0AAZ3RFZ5_ONCTS
MFGLTMTAVALARAQMTMLQTPSNCVGLSAPPFSTLIMPEPVRHSRIPDLPLGSSLLFEFLLFLYLLVTDTHTHTQYINIYRTVWCSNIDTHRVSHTHTCRQSQTHTQPPAASTSLVIRRLRARPPCPAPVEDTCCWLRRNTQVRRLTP